MIALARATTLAELAARFGGRADDDATDEVDRIEPTDAAGPRALAPLFAKRNARVLHEGAVFLVGDDLADLAPRGRRWIHPRPVLALARLLATLERPAEPARIDASAIVGPGVVVLPGAVISARVRIEPNAVIYGGSTIAEDVVIGANAVIGRAGFGWTHDESGVLVRIPQLGGVVVERDAEIGPLVTVDAGTLAPTVIARGAKLDAHVHVGHNARIGEGTLVAAQSGFAGSVRVGRGVLVGGQAGVADHVTIGDDARLAAKAGVIGDVSPGATVAGYPAVARGRWLRAMAKLLRGGT